MATQPVEIKEGRVLSKKNIFIRSGANLNLAEQTLFNVILYVAMKSYKSAMTNTIQIDLSELKKVMKYRIRLRNTKDLLDICVKLRKKTITFDAVGIKEEGEKQGLAREFLGDGLINNFTLSEENDIAIFELSSLMLSVLRSEKGEFGFNYTKIPLYFSLTAKKKAAIRLYEYFFNYYNKNRYHTIPKMTLDELRAFLDVKYSNWTDFKRGLLNPTIEYLKDEFGMDVAIKNTYKDGKKVTGLLFKVVSFEPKINFEPLNREDDSLLALPDLHAIQSNVEYFGGKIASWFKNYGLRVEAGYAHTRYKIISSSSGKEKFYSFEQVRECCEGIDIMVKRLQNKDNNKYINNETFVEINHFFSDKKEREPTSRLEEIMDSMPSYYFHRA